MVGSSQVIHRVQGLICTEFKVYNKLIYKAFIDNFDLLTSPTTTTVYIYYLKNSNN